MREDGGLGGGGGGVHCYEEGDVVSHGIDWVALVENGPVAEGPAVIQRWANDDEG